MDLPPLIFHCSLEGVRPLNGADDWSDKACSFFAQFIEDRFHADRQGVDVFLFATASTSPDATEGGAQGLIRYHVRIDSKEEISILAKKMIQRGLAQDAAGHKVAEE